MDKNQKPYDLEERTLKFSGDVIFLLNKIKKDLVTTPISSQLIRSATSIGANYCEANGASSKKDFKNKIYICKKEAKETKYWLLLLTKALPEMKKDCENLSKEIQELILIFSKIVQTIEKSKN